MTALIKTNSAKKYQRTYQNPLSSTVSIILKSNRTFKPLEMFNRLSLLNGLSLDISFHRRHTPLFINLFTLTEYLVRGIVVDRKSKDSMHS